MVKESKSNGHWSYMPQYHLSIYFIHINHIHMKGFDLKKQMTNGICFIFSQCEINLSGQTTDKPV